MIKTVRVFFDGEVLRPEQPLDLEPNSRYLVTIEDEVPAPMGLSEESYPLTQIARLATDMGVSDLSTRHDAYAHGCAQDEDSDL